MKAKLVPYESKYYGTKVEIYFSDDEDDFEEITIWRNSTSKPSIRQIKYRNKDYTQEDWDNNVEIESYIYQEEMRPIQEEIIPCDSHFETEESYKLALELIDRVNSAEK